MNGTTDLYSLESYFRLPLDLALKIHSSGLFFKVKGKLASTCRLSGAF